MAANACAQPWGDGSCSKFEERVRESASKRGSRWRRRSRGEVGGEGAGGMLMSFGESGVAGSMREVSVVSLL
jgi:hypothetical protein